MDRAKPGHTVEFKDLKGASHLNGTEGVLVQYHPSNSRWAVRRGNNEVVAVKPQNLILRNKANSGHVSLEDYDVEALKRGYKWHTEDREENSLSWNEWVDLAASVIKNFDEKILMFHGCTRWDNGNRADNGAFNVKFFHICDALVATKNPMCPLVTNVEDGLTPKEVAFVRDNFDFLWVAYHAINSKHPVELIPETKRTDPLFFDKSYQKIQANKENELTAEEILNDWMLWIADRHGILKRSNA